MLKLQSAVQKSLKPICSVFRAHSLSKSLQSSFLSPQHVCFLLIALLIALCSMPFSTADAAQVELTWEPPSGSVTGYKVHYGGTSGNYDHSVDVGNSIGCTISGLQEGETYYFAATAYNAVDESNFSEELVHTIPFGITSEASFPNNDPQVIEADNGYLQAPMELVSDVDASSGMSIWVPNGQGSVYNPSQDAGYAEYDFEVPEAGNYVIWGRVLAVNGRADSFFISMDSGDFALWDTQQAGSYVWDQVNNRGDSDPVVYYLVAGAHTLTIKQREDGTIIDRILITNDMDYVPLE